MAGAGAIGTVPGQTGPQPSATVGVGGTISRPEVDILISNQNTLLTTVRELRSLVGDIHAKADSILQNQQRAPSGQVQATGYDIQSAIHEMRDGMNQVKQGLSHMSQK